MLIMVKHSKQPKLLEMPQLFNTFRDIHMTDCSTLMLYNKQNIQNDLVAVTVKSTFSCIYCLGLNFDCGMQLTLASSSVP